MKIKTLAIMAGITAMLASCKTASNEAADTTPVQEGITSPAIETMLARRSVRAYKPQPVSRDTMQVILECGVNAPNAMNRQTWEIRVVDNQEAIAEVTAAFVKGYPQMAEDEGFVNMFRNAPTVIFIATDPNSKFGQIDCGLLGGNIVNAAKSLGVGTCCLGGPVQFIKSPEGKFFLDKLGFSEGFELTYAIAAGYPAEEPEAKPRDLSKIRFID